MTNSAHWRRISIFSLPTWPEVSTRFVFILNRIPEMPSCPLLRILETCTSSTLPGTQRTERGETDGIVLGVFLVRNKVAAQKRVYLRLLRALVHNQFSCHRRPGLS